MYALPPGIKPDPVSIPVRMLDALYKGEVVAGVMGVPGRGLASYDSLDLDGETVDQLGLDFDTLAIPQGFLIDGHPYSPGKRVGRLVSVEPAIDDGNYCTILNFILWTHKARGLEIYHEHIALIRAGKPGYGLSIEGHALERRGNRIVRVLVTHVAIDKRPRHPRCLVDQFTGSELEFARSAGRTANVEVLKAHLRQRFPQLEAPKLAAFADSWLRASKGF